MAIKILLITDHEFWLVDRGDRQRISELIHYLGRRYDLSVVVIDPHSNSQLDANIARIQNQHSISSLSRIKISTPSRQKHKGFLIRRLSYLRSVCTKIANKLRFRLFHLPSSVSAPVPHLSALFSGYSGIDLDPALYRLKPDAVIIEYLRLHPLLHSVRRCLPSTLILLDSHDVLSHRSQAFSRYGYSHWCTISPRDEARLMGKYDKIIAINQRDQLLISDLIGTRKVLIAGHPSPRLLDSIHEKDEATSDNPKLKLRVLFLASGGAANLDALKVLISYIIPSLFSLSDSFEVFIAGSICLVPTAQELIERSDMYPISCLGIVKSLESLYGSVDIISNPVRFGGGLKIKNIEALAAGCALVTSTEGSCGLPVTDPPCFLVADDPDDHAQKLFELITNPSLLISLRKRAFDAARLHLSPESVYKDLREYLDSIPSIRE